MSSLLALEAGVHEITAQSGSGASLSESFAVSGGGTRYAVVDYWDDDNDPTHLSWLFQQQPVAFG